MANLAKHSMHRLKWHYQKKQRRGTTQKQCCTSYIKYPDPARIRPGSNGRVPGSGTRRNLLPVPPLDLIHFKRVGKFLFPSIAILRSYIGCNSQWLSLSSGYIGIKTQDSCMWLWEISSSVELIHVLVLVQLQQKTSRENSYLVVRLTSCLKNVKKLEISGSLLFGATSVT